MDTSIAKYPLSEIRPLNLAADAYSHHFRQPPPRHLGIGLVGVLDDRSGDVDARLRFAWRSLTASSIVRELLEFPDFRQAYLPSLVTDISVDHTLEAAMPDFWNAISAPQRRWVSKGGFVNVVFYNAAVPGHNAWLIALSDALSLYDRWFADTGTTIPEHHAPLAVDPAFAADYVATVDDAYLNGYGIWRESLLLLRHQLMLAARAFIDGGSFAQSVEAARSVQRSYYWER